MRVKLQAGQNLLDIAVQYCGSIDAVYALHEKNGFDIGIDIPAGTAIIIPEILKPKIVKYFSDNNIIIATNGTD